MTVKEQKFTIEFDIFAIFWNTLIVEIHAWYIYSLFKPNVALWWWLLNDKMNMMVTKTVLLMLIWSWYGDDYDDDDV